MGVLENIPADQTLRWAALLHDIGKPRTKSVHEGQVHFFGHEDVGERMARHILRRLHFDTRLVERWPPWYGCTCGSTRTRASGRIRPCGA